MATVAVARAAMATRFEIVVQGNDPLSLRAAADTALDEIERLDAQLSRHRPDSEISRLNAQATHGAVPVEPGLFGLLRQARDWHRLTAGAFDLTTAPLLQCWGWAGGGGRVPEPDALAAARDRVGMDLVVLDERTRTVRFRRDGVRLDLGAIGKGYALDRAAEVLREAGVGRALLHAGTSSVYALGTPEDAPAWSVALPHPHAAMQQAGWAPPTPCARTPDPLLAVIPLQDRSLSVSAIWGRGWSVGNRFYGHVLDPRTGRPVEGTLMAAVVAASATESDALATALLVLGGPGQECLAQLGVELQTLVVTEGGRPGQVQIGTRGIGLLS